MAIVLFDRGAFRVVARYVEQRGGTYYFRRRIPDDVRPLYPGRKGFLFFSLKTSDPMEAARRADEEARRQDALWET